MGLIEPNEPDVIDVDLSAIRKKRFRMVIDPNKPELNQILELNVSDLGIVDRMNTAYKELNEFEAEAQKLLSEIEELENSTEEEQDEDESLGRGLEVASKNLNTIDKKMRDLIDFIFDSNVSEICAPFGSMYDPINGMLRYEYIIDKVANLYEDGLDSEMKKIKRNTSKHTAKYTKKRKR